VVEAGIRMIGISGIIVMIATITTREYPASVEETT
jgi:hypothetical protein